MSEKISQPRQELGAKAGDKARGSARLRRTYTRQPSSRAGWFGNAQDY